VLRSPEGYGAALSVPIKGSRVWMPDRQWWRHFYACKNFGPETVDGHLKSGGVFRCFDSDRTAINWGHHWQWDFRGRNVAPSHFDDMPQVRAEWRGWTVDVYRWDIPW
jgi:hypothetical protein